MRRIDKIISAPKPPLGQAGYVPAALGDESPGNLFGKLLTKLKTFSNNDANESLIKFRKYFQNMPFTGSCPVDEKTSHSTITSREHAYKVRKTDKLLTGGDQGSMLNPLQGQQSIPVAEGRSAQSGEQTIEYAYNKSAETTGLTGSKKRVIHKAGVRVSRDILHKTKPAARPLTNRISKNTSVKVSHKISALPGSTVMNKTKPGLSETEAEPTAHLQKIPIKGTAKIDVPPLPSTTLTGRRRSHIPWKSAFQEKPVSREGHSLDGLKSLKSSRAAATIKKQAVGLPSGITKAKTLPDNLSIKGAGKIDVPPLPSKISNSAERFSFSRQSAAPRTADISGYPLRTNTAGIDIDKPHQRRIYSRNSVILQKQTPSVRPVSGERTAGLTKAEHPGNGLNISTLQARESAIRFKASHLTANDHQENRISLPEQAYGNDEKLVAARTAIKGREFRENNRNTKQNLRARPDSAQEPKSGRPVTGKTAVKNSATIRNSILTGDLVYSDQSTRNYSGEDTKDGSSAKAPIKTISAEWKVPAGETVLDIGRKILPDGDNPAGGKSALTNPPLPAVVKPLLMTPPGMKSVTGSLWGNTRDIFPLLLAQRLTEGMQTPGSNPSGSFSLTLDTGNLGQIQIECEQSLNEHAVTLYAASEEARASIIGVLPAVLENLSSKGYLISQFDVRMKDFDKKGATDSRHFRQERRDSEKVIPDLPEAEAGSVLAIKNYGYNTMEVIA